MRLRNHLTTNTDGGSEALPRSTRRSFLRYLGVGAASTALVSVVFGILIALWPGAGLLTVIWLVSIYAIVFGVVYLAAYFQSRSLTARLT